MSFSKPAFLATAATHVLLVLDARKDRQTIGAYGVRSYPNFAILDADGQAILGPDKEFSSLIRRQPPV